MIDLGISKLALIGVVALIVIGPEKLPRVARMAGTLLGRAQRYINDVKAEVSKEIELDELRKMQKDVQEAAHNVEQSVSQSWNEIRFHLPLTARPMSVPNNWRVRQKSFAAKNWLKLLPFQVGTKIATGSAIILFPVPHAWRAIALKRARL